MKVILASTAGFCFGVDRAVKLADECAGNAATLGPIIHNSTVTHELEERGVRIAQGVDELRPGETAIICSHGAPRAVHEELKRRGIEYVDATCPYVKRIHDTVAKESAQGRQVVIIGQAQHTEVKGIAGWCESPPLVFENAEEFSKWLDEAPENRSKALSVVSQTTLDISVWEQIVNFLKNQCTNAKKFDTICKATILRQREAAQIAAGSDAMVIAGDKRSANTRRLYELCRRYCENVFLVENAAGLGEFGDFSTVGVTAGASTPRRIIMEVCKKMSDEILNVTGEDVNTAAEPAVENAEPAAPVAAEADKVIEPAAVSEDATFAEMLEQTFKTLNNGDKVKGVVTGISGTEVQVDLGTKHAGYIPLAELGDDQEFISSLKVGDEIEASVIRVNDVEGTAMLSKRRLDSAKGWEDVEAAVESHETMEGYITEENKGGVVASVKGVRVFIPASQTGVPRGGSLSGLVKTKVRLKITEVNRARRRVVGSISAVTREERKAKAEQVWNEIEEGKIYEGVVKSMTNYGVFVDIGGVDGMVHISELSWQRVRHPQDVVSVGDTVTVHVLSFDREKKKISLGLRTAEDNPWTKFVAGYNIGDVITAKVVKLMTFGAFAEIIPGVDGLIHISQIADHRIGKPGDVLSEGQEVQCKITNVDYDKQKVWLSIRALLEADAADGSAQDDEPAEEDTGDGIVASSEAGVLTISKDIADVEE